MSWLLDNIIDLIRFLFNYEHLVMVSPIVALAIMFYSQAKYPLDKTIKYSDYAKTHVIKIRVSSCGLIPIN